MNDRSVFLIQVHDSVARDPRWGRLVGAPSQAAALDRAKEMRAEAISVAVIRLDHDEQGRVIDRHLIKRWGALPPGASCEAGIGAVEPETDEHDAILSLVLEEIVGPARPVAIQ